MVKKWMFKKGQRAGEFYLWYGKNDVAAGRAPGITPVLKV